MRLGEAEINPKGQRGSFVSPSGGELSEATMPWEVLGAAVPKGATVPKPPCAKGEIHLHQQRGSGTGRGKREDGLVGSFAGGTHLSPLTAKGRTASLAQMSGSGLELPRLGKERSMLRLYKASSIREKKKTNHKTCQLEIADRASHHGNKSYVPWR